MIYCLYRISKNNKFTYITLRESEELFSYLKKDGWVYQSFFSGDASSCRERCSLLVLVESRNPNYFAVDFHGHDF